MSRTPKATGTEIKPTPHPAKFSDEVIATIRNLVEKYQMHGWLTLDPFAGVGKIFDAIPELDWHGFELEPEWAIQHRRITIGDCIAGMQEWKAAEFRMRPYAIITSPAYGNRMADQAMLPDRGAGLVHSYNTYAYKLGRVLDLGNGARYLFHSRAGGVQYRKIHTRAWKAAVELLEDGGLFVLNVKDYSYTRHGERVEVDVTGWHVGVLEGFGLRELERIPVFTPGNRFGENSEVRAEHEWVIVLQKGTKI